MGDKSSKNIHKKEEQHDVEKVDKIHHKHENAELQHHPVSGHPKTPEEPEPAEKIGETETDRP